MNIIVKYFNLIKRYFRLSFLNLLQFPVDFFMNFVMIIFDIGTILIFWISLFDLGIVINNWRKCDLLVFVAMNIFSEGISKLTFGFRDLEYFVIDGSFDKFLIRPLNPIFSLLMSKINICTVAIKIILSIIFLSISSYCGNMYFSNIFLAFTISVIGTISLELLYGTFSLLSFWIGKIYTARELIFSFREARKYPIDIFPGVFCKIFTYFIPLAFLCTIPSKILLNKYSNPYIFLIIVVVIFLLIVCLFNILLKKALLKYTSAGC